MNAYLRSLVLAGVAAAATFSAPAVRADQPNLAVVSEDADTDTVPRDSRIFNRVLLALAEEMNLHHYTVIDERAAGMEITTPDRVRRRDVELIDIARALRRPPVDAVVVFQIYASTRQSLNSDIVRAQVRIPARIIEVQSGRFLGAFEVSDIDLPALPRRCDRECLLEVMGNNARILGHDLGIALAQKLDAWKVPPGPGPAAGLGPDPGFRGPPGPGPVAGLGPDPALIGRGPPGPGPACSFSTAFPIVFEGFNPQEITEVEDFLSRQPCYEHLRVINVRGSRAEYWYETSTLLAVLNHDIRVKLDEMGLPNQIQLGAGGAMRIVKIATR
jgi:hypothetical protein